MRLALAACAALAAATLSVSALAQHHHHHGQAKGARAEDPRQLVRFPPLLVEETQANMRSHLLALRTIQEQLGAGDTDAAAKTAELELGMSSMPKHGAAEVSRYMPKGMQDAGSAMHRAASRFSIVAKDAGVTGEMKPVFAALAEITAQCVGCHAGYRFR